MAIGRLIGALHSTGLEMSLDDLRDVLWLAEHISVESNGEENDPKAIQAPSTLGKSVEPSSEMPIEYPQVARSLRQNVLVESTQALYGSVPGQSGGEAARLVRVRGAPALPNALQIVRALRPLSRRRAGNRAVVDERATAEQMAESRLPTVVYRHALERWFDVDVLAENVPTMIAWRPVLLEFERLLRRQAGFRSVRSLRLWNVDDRLCAVRPDGVAVPASALADWTGRRIILIASDCTSAVWRDGRMGEWVETIAESTPVAIAQFLPRSLWPNTAIGFAELRVRSTAVALPTAQLQVLLPSWAIGEPGIAVPVFSMTPAMVAEWARMTSSAGDAWATAALLPLPDEDDPSAIEPGIETGISGELRASRFRASATIEAQQLAAYLSVVKPLTPPVMRVIQRAVAPASNAAALAQVFLGRLLHPVSETSLERNPDDIEYDFYPELRDLLAQALTPRQFVEVSLALHAFLQELSGTQFDFFALLLDSSGDEQLPPAARPFAAYSRMLAGKFGLAHTVNPMHQAYGVETLSISKQKGGFVFEHLNRGGSLKATTGRLDVSERVLATLYRDEDYGLAKKLAEVLVPKKELAQALKAESTLCELVLDHSVARYPWEVLLGTAFNGLPMLVARRGFTRRIVPELRHRPVPEEGAIVIALEGNKQVIGPRAEDLKKRAAIIADALNPIARSGAAQLVGTDFGTASDWLQSRDFRVAHVMLRDAEPRRVRRTLQAETDDWPNLAGLFSQASQLPELLFFEKSIGADRAIELLKMGARVVVEPVSQMNPQEALVFATTFYTRLSEGFSLIQAVCDARADHAASSSANNLHAFACYGDPEWTIAGNGQPNEAAEIWPIDQKQASQKNLDAEEKRDLSSVRVVAIGLAAITGIQQAPARKWSNVDLVALASSKSALASSAAAVKIHLGGMNEERTTESQTVRRQIEDALFGAEIVFLVACLDEDSDSFAVPVVAEIARRVNVLTVALVSTPVVRPLPPGRNLAARELARISKISSRAHSLLVTSLARLKNNYPDKDEVELLSLANSFFVDTIYGITEIVNTPGHINIDINDLKMILASGPEVYVGIGSGFGHDRVESAMKAALTSSFAKPMDAQSVHGAMVNVTASRGLKGREIKQVMAVIRTIVRPDAAIAQGIAYDDTMQDELRVTVILTGSTPNNDSMMN